MNTTNEDILKRLKEMREWHNNLRHSSKTKNITINEALLTKQEKHIINTILKRTVKRLLSKFKPL